MKVISKKDIFIILFSLPVIAIAIIVALFYFYPIPQSLDRMVKSGGTVERCVYNGSINYAVTFELTTIQQESIVMIMYSPAGETICTSHGRVNGKKQEPCSNNRVCLPIYGQ